LGEFAEEEAVAVPAGPAAEQVDPAAGCVVEEEATAFAAERVVELADSGEEAEAAVPAELAAERACPGADCFAEEAALLPAVCLAAPAQSPACFAAVEAGSAVGWAARAGCLAGSAADNWADSVVLAGQG
jgi:hypothetical protein